MAKPNNKVKKAFALSSIVGAMLMASNNGNPSLTALKVQIDKAMKVFSIKAGKKTYYGISDKVQKLWVEVAKEHNNTLDEDEITLFVEMVLNLMPKKDMKTFLMVHFTTRETMRDDKKSAIIATVLEIDRHLNELFGTEQTITREALGKILVKTPKLKKVKLKLRDKNTKAQEKHEKIALEHKERKERISKFLLGVREKAKAQRETKKETA
ncbi:MAG: hypothetical protein GQ474_01560 [Sulfurimonas sp.]|nr:hypothetical protein [Sulfurimonas sp.]